MGEAPSKLASLARKYDTLFPTGTSPGPPSLRCTPLKHVPRACIAAGTKRTALRRIPALIVSLRTACYTEYTRRASLDAAKPDLPVFVRRVRFRAVVHGNPASKLPAAHSECAGALWPIGTLHAALLPAPCVAAVPRERLYICMTGQCMRACGGGGRAVREEARASVPLGTSAVLVLYISEAGAHPR